jgi:hypothetical protein
MPVVPEELTFQEALEYLRQKTELPTRQWTDLVRSEHDRAFVVSGATKMDLLADLKGAVQAAIEDGETLEGFRDRFDDIVAKRGWDFRGGRNWRTRVIYETNLRTAHAAGRNERMTDPDVLEQRPFWQYLHTGALNPRERHKYVWDGMVLRHDDPWWEDHDPPNGWGCGCIKVSLSKEEMEAEGLEVSESPEVKTYEWTNPNTGEVEDIPKGIDPAWNYSPGESWRRGQTPAFREDWPTSAEDVPSGAVSAPEGDASMPSPRPARLVDGSSPEGTDAPDDAPQLLSTGQAAEAYRQQFVDELGGRPTSGGGQVLTDKAGEPVIMDEEAADLPEALRPYAQLVGRTIRDPDEIWARLEPKAEAPGQYLGARYYLARWDTGTGEPTWTLVQWTNEGWHAVATAEKEAIEELRQRRGGVRLYRRGQ